MGHCTDTPGLCHCEESKSRPFGPMTNLLLIKARHRFARRVLRASRDIIFFRKLSAVDFFRSRPQGTSTKDARNRKPSRLFPVVPTFVPNWHAPAWLVRDYFPSCRHGDSPVESGYCHGGGATDIIGSGTVRRKDCLRDDIENSQARKEGDASGRRSG